MAGVAKAAGEGIGNWIVEQRRQYDNIRTEASQEVMRNFRDEEEERVKAVEQNIVGAEYDALARNLQILQESLEVREKLKGNPFAESGGEEQLRQVERFLYQVEQESKRAAASTGNLQSNLTNTVSRTRALKAAITLSADEMERMAKASSQINMPSIPTAAIASHAKGGLVQVARHLSQGGFQPQGTDTVPAMLSPGEFVVNARSSRQFFSELVAINAGVQPVYRQEGGPVTNVGDIHVIVQGGQSARQSARTIAAGVRRELRRGTSTL